MCENHHHSPFKGFINSANLLCWLVIGAGLITLQPATVSAQTPLYRTVVRTTPLNEQPPADDPVGFNNTINLKRTEEGTSLAQELNRIPGVHIKESGLGSRQSISLRGTEGQQVAVYLDGIKLSFPSGAVDLSLFDPIHLKQVEVRRGGGSVRYGSDALGGALILKTPQLSSRERSSISLRYGSWDTVAVGASQAAAYQRLRYWWSGSYQQSEGNFPYIDENGQARVRMNNDSRMGEGLLKLDYLFSERWQAGILNDLALAQRGAPGMSQNPSSTARQHDIRNVTALQLTRRRLLLPGSRLDLTISHRYGQFQFDEPTPPVVYSHNQSYALEGDLRFSLPFPDRGQFDSGLEIRDSLFRDPDTNNPQRFESALWASSQTQLFNHRLVIVPAFRLAYASEYPPTLIPRLGMMLYPWAPVQTSQLQSLALVGNIGRSFRYPSFHEMFVRLDGFGGNANLLPEDAVDGDIGLRWRTARLSLEVAYFRRYLKNMILFAPVSSFLVRADNYPNARSQGVEAQVAIHALFGFSLSTSYTYSESLFSEPAMPLPGHPPHRLVARLEWDSYEMLGRLISHNWKIGLWTSATAQSAMVLSRFNANPEEGRIWLAAGTSISYRVFSIVAEGQNLLDKRDAVDVVGFPLPPANFRVSLVAKL